EDALLGRGVSYCATCDGRLYRGKTAAVIGNADDLAHEVDLLRQIGVSVTVVGTKRPEALAEDVPFVNAKPLAVSKEEVVLLKTDSDTISCDVVFILRNEQAMDNLLPGLATDGRFVTVDARMATNVPGVFAAGDCTGRPLQVAKAVADGLIAAWSATDSLK
ncbi:MAG: FAD-dependent oxidoreductase, partial [Clostridia bacterium]|nr:FAD-dependent oxidoreductase [Clostridia bacterium]